VADIADLVDATVDADDREAEEVRSTRASAGM
jgi:hypothetical protein